MAQANMGLEEGKYLALRMLYQKGLVRGGHDLPPPFDDQSLVHD